MTFFFFFKTYEWLVAVVRLTINITMSNQHTKRNYVDRSQILAAKSQKKCNFVNGLKAMPCSQMGRLFRYKLAVPNDIDASLPLSSLNQSSSNTTSEIMLMAMVLANGICVLMIDDSASSISATTIDISKVETIEFSEGLSTDCISGKKKKGAVKLQAGSIIGTMGITTTSTDPMTSSTKKYQMITPVGGQLLELNSQLQNNPHLISQAGGLGYLAVIYPDTEIPTPESQIDSHPKGKTVSKDWTCHAFQKGECKRGDKCRFLHELAKVCTSDSDKDVDGGGGVGEMVDSTDAMTRDAEEKEEEEEEEEGGGESPSKRIKV